MGLECTKCRRSQESSVCFPGQEDKAEGYSCPLLPGWGREQAGADFFQTRAVKGWEVTDALQHRKLRLDSKSRGPERL